MLTLAAPGKYVQKAFITIVHYNRIFIQMGKNPCVEIIVPETVDLNFFLDLLVNDSRLSDF